MAIMIQHAAIDDIMLRSIYASDQDMYPAPLSFARLQAWRDACPELSILFRTIPEDGSSPVDVGAIIVLPILKNHWEDLLAGKLKEIDVDAATMLAKGKDADVGLHVFHIEKFEASALLGRLRHFAEFALENTRDIVDQKGWNVFGYSALTATPAGQAVCARMAFKPTGYREIFIKSADSETKEPERLFIYPGRDGTQSSGEVEERLEGTSVLNTSEMVVRYLNDQFYSEKADSGFRVAGK